LPDLLVLTAEGSGSFKTADESANYKNNPAAISSHFSAYNPG
jgi:hypothetical protein